MNKKKHNALCYSLSKIYTSYIGEKRIVKEVEKKNALGYTGLNKIIYVAASSPLFDSLDESEQAFFITGVFAHELLHQLFTDFTGKVRIANSYSDFYEKNMFCRMENLLEDPAIEFFSNTVIGGTLLKALNYTIAKVYEQTPNIECAGTPYGEFETALIQFGDMGLLKGHFTFPEAKEVFVKAAPIFSAGIEEPDSEKRLNYAKELTELSKPLWIKEAQNQEFLRKIIESLKNDLQETSDKQSNPEKNDTSESTNQRRRKITFKKITEEEKKELEKQQKTKKQQDDGTSDIEVLYTDEDLEKMKNQQKDENQAPADLEGDIPDIESDSDDKTNSDSSSNQKSDSKKESENDSNESSNKKSDENSENNSNKSSDNNSGDEMNNESNDSSSDSNRTSEKDSEGDSEESEGDSEGSKGNSNNESEKESDVNSDNNSSENSDFDNESEKESDVNSDNNSSENSDFDNDSDLNSDKNATEKINNSQVGKSTSWKNIPTEIDGQDELPEESEPFDLSDFEPEKQDLESIMEDIEVGIKELNKAENQSLLSKNDFENIDISGDYPHYKNVKTYNEPINVNSMHGSYIEAYNSLLPVLNNTINSLVVSLKKIFQADAEEKDYHTNGKINLKRLNTGKLTTRVFDKRREPKKKADLAIAIAIDESGSMSGSKCRSARETAIILAETFAKFDIPLYIIGFHEGNGFQGYHRHYLAWKNNKVTRLNLLSITSGGSNFDGYAIRTITKILKKKEATHKILIIISDGQPASTFYRGTSGILDTKAAVREATKVADIIGVGIETYDTKILASMYGKNFVSIDKAFQLKSILPKRIKSIIEQW